MSKIIQLYQNIGADIIKIFDTDPTTLKALANVNINVFVAATNDELQYLTNQNNANIWVKNHIKLYTDNNVRITHIFVGNEVLAPWYNNAYVNMLMPAMNNVANALQKYNLQRIKVVTPLEPSVMACSYPPSCSSYRADIQPIIKELLTFYKKYNSPFCVNLYPYIAHISNPKDIGLEYAKGTLNTIAFTDNGKSYNDLLSAQLDAIYSANKNLGITIDNYIISESGFPTSGGTDATLENARDFNQAVYKKLIAGSGTPLIHSGNIIVIYFSIADENTKYTANGATEYERHFGIHDECGVQKYPLKA